MDAFKVGHLRLVSGLHQRIEAGLHQLGNAAAQNSLLTEQVGLCLLAEAGFQNAGAARADAAGIRKRDVLGMAAVVLLDGDQAGHALALHILAAHRMAGALGRDHDHVEVRGGFYELEVDVEAVGEHQHIALLHIGRDLLVIDIGGDLVRHQHHHDVGGLRGLGHFHHGQAGLLGFGPACAVLAQADDDLHAALLQVLRVGMALAAVAHDGDGFAVEHPQIAIGVIILFDHTALLPL